MSVDFTPLRPRDHAWAALWHPPVILPRLPLPLCLRLPLSRAGRACRPGRALRAGEQAAPRARRYASRVFP